MIVNMSGRLRVLDNFERDQTLPKFKARPAPTGYRMGSISIGDDSMDSEIGEDSDEEPLVMIKSPFRSSKFVPSGVLTVSTVPQERGLWATVKDWFQSAPRTEPSQMSVQEFFRSVHDSVEELVVVDHRADGYNRLLHEAKANGQVALVEQLLAGLAAARSESQLVAMGMTRVVSEETLIGFVTKCERGLRLDWLKNFTRPIPADVQAKKVAADQRGVFDAYVVLHFDPENKGSALTQAEVEKKRDPILFGLMEDRRVLYFVGDWVDEYCDLTLDKLADTMGASAVGDIT